MRSQRLQPADERVREGWWPPWCMAGAARGFAALKAQLGLLWGLGCSKGCTRHYRRQKLVLVLPIRTLVLRLCCRWLAGVGSNLQVTKAVSHVSAASQSQGLSTLYAQSGLRVTPRSACWASMP